MPRHLQAAWLEMEANRAEQERNLDMQKAHKHQVELAKVLPALDLCCCLGTQYGAEVAGSVLNLIMTRSMHHYWRW